MAQRLEEAKFHGIFFADVLGIYDVYKGNGPALESAAQIPILDVSLLISAMAYATKDISFGITASTTYENPYALARKFSTLDQVSDGRVGWNIVTSYLQSAADSFGLDEQIEHDERYTMADEFMTVVYKLLEGSWDDGAVEADRKSGVYANPEKVHKINHVQYSSVSLVWLQLITIDNVSGNITSVPAQIWWIHPHNERHFCYKLVLLKRARLSQPLMQRPSSSPGWYLRRPRRSYALSKPLCGNWVVQKTASDS